MWKFERKLENRGKNWKLGGGELEIREKIGNLEMNLGWKMIIVLKLEISLRFDKKYFASYHFRLVIFSLV